MADDASYSSFLNKANEPVSAQKQEDKSTSQAKSGYDPTSSDSAVPDPISTLLSSANPTYTSDTDSPFEPVFFSYSGDDLPTGKEFSQCLSKGKHTKGEVEVMSVKEFDPQGQYESVIDAVSEAAGSGEGDVKVYRVEVSKTRAEYYILTVADRKLVGVVTKAVES